VNLQVPWNAGNFLRSCTIGGFSRWLSSMSEWVSSEWNKNIYTTQRMFHVRDQLKVTNLVEVSHGCQPGLKKELSAVSGMRPPSTIGIPLANE
jgi:hypothetical protein